MFPSLYDASLRRCFLDELIIVINNPLEIITAIVEFPQLLINGSLIVQDIDDEFFADIFAWAGGVLQYFFWLFQKYQCKLELLFLIDKDLTEGLIEEVQDGAHELLWDRRIWYIYHL